MFSTKQQKHRVVTLTLVLRSSCVITNAPPVIASTCFGYHGQAHSLIFFEVCIGAHGLTLTGGMLLTGARWWWAGGGNGSCYCAWECSRGVVLAGSK